MVGKQTIEQLSVNPIANQKLKILEQWGIE
jgi:hypothetical protein